MEAKVKSRMMNSSEAHELLEDFLLEDVFDIQDIVAEILADEAGISVEEVAGITSKANSRIIKANADALAGEVEKEVFDSTIENELFMVLLMCMGSISLGITLLVKLNDMKDSLKERLAELYKEEDDGDGE